MWLQIVIIIVFVRHAIPHTPRRKAALGERLSKRNPSRSARTNKPAEMVER
jgi:hypothetical protein